jgi:Winged helix-turn helix
MPAAHACQLVLAAGDRHRLKRLERSQTAPYRLVLRAKIVLLAARPLPNAQIAARLGVTTDTARKWRGRFAANGMDGLAGRPRPGRPARFTPRAGGRGQGAGLPAARRAGCAAGALERPGLAREAIIRGITAAVSATTVGRWLAEDAIKPWQHRSWIFIRDPDFHAKASRVLDLYAHRWQGHPLGPDEYVLCTEEKTSIQARCRCHPTLPPGTPAACGSTTTTTAAARWSTWPPTTPAAPACSATAQPPDRAIRASGSTTTPRIRERSMTSPPSTPQWPAGSVAVGEDLAREPAPNLARILVGHSSAGRMFSLSRKRLSGSY